MHFAQGSWSFKRHFSNLRDNNSVEGLLSHLSQLREECVSHIDRVIELITQRKEEYEVIFKELDKEIAETKDTLKQVTEDIENLRIAQEQQISDYTKLLQDEEKEQTEILRTPEIQSLNDELYNIVKVWNEGKGQKCERCGKIQNLSISGWVNLHLNYRRDGSYFTCGAPNDLFSWMNDLQ